jgi:hypothetical protein
VPSAAYAGSSNVQEMPGESEAYPALTGGTFKGSATATANDGWLTEQVVVSSPYFRVVTYVYFDVVFTDKRSGRVVFELFGAATPRACEHFRLMCALPNGRFRNVPIVPINQMSATVGDDVQPIVPMSLADERPSLGHDAPYLLSIPRGDTTGPVLDHVQAGLDV